MVFLGQREVRERGDEDYGPTVYKSSMYMNEDPEVSQASVFKDFRLFGAKFRKKFFF